MEHTVEAYTKAFDDAGFDLSITATPGGQSAFLASAVKRPRRSTGPMGRPIHSPSHSTGPTGGGATDVAAAADCWTRYDHDRQAYD